MIPDVHFISLPRCNLPVCFFLREFEWGIDNRGIECHYLMGFFYDEGIKAKMIHLHTRVSFGIENFLVNQRVQVGKDQHPGFLHWFSLPFFPGTMTLVTIHLTTLSSRHTRDIDFIDWIFLIRNLSRWHCIISPAGKMWVRLVAETQPDAIKNYRKLKVQSIYKMCTFFYFIYFLGRTGK